MDGNVNVVGIIQARMGSTRLPGKVLKTIRDKPLLWHAIHRARSTDTLDKVVVATTTADRDDDIFSFCETENVPCFRGSEEDVLKRYYDAAVEYDAEIIVRLTGDDPLKDPDVIDNVVHHYLETNVDYTSNTLQYTYPDGMDVEVFSFDALARANKEAEKKLEREHVTPYIKNSDTFDKRNVESDTDPTDFGIDPDVTLRWTVDYAQDLEFVREVYDRLWAGEDDPFGYEAVLNLLGEFPSLLEINKDVVGNEGYFRSLIEEGPLPENDRPLDRSKELLRRAKTLIPNQAQTLSKSPTQFTRGVAPAYVERSEGCYVWDVDGNKYIDYPMAIGPLILGHRHPVVEEAVRRQLEMGTSYSLPHRLEVDVAERIRETIPCAEMVRFGKNGSDATSCAVRLARSYTGRDKIAVCGYHGFQDWYITTKESYNDGVPASVGAETLGFGYNDIGSLEELFEEHRNEIAGVIMEPTLEARPEDGFLEDIRELTESEDSLLIFDEIKMGFRVPNGSAGAYFGVEPDLACFGKALANGHPLSAVVGAERIMRELEDSTFFSLTFGGEALSLAAANATLEFLDSEKVVPHLFQEGQRLKNGYNLFAEEYGLAEYTECVGLPPWTVIEFRDELGDSSPACKTLFQQECLKRGVLFGGYHVMSYSHGKQDVDDTLRVYRTAMEVLADAIESGTVSDQLEGSIIEPVFE